MKLKGQTTIELKNIKTGKIERYEDNNLVTNAVSKMVDFAINHSCFYNGSGFRNPYATHLDLMSGLVCFDQHIANANENTLYPPNNVTPIAYGVPGFVTAYSDLSEMGIYASDESGSTSNSRTWVYNFDENHGNGTISCICLTNKNTGYLGFGPKDNRLIQHDFGDSSLTDQTIMLGHIPYCSQKGHLSITRYREKWGSMTSSSSYVDFCIDSDEDVKYMFRVSSDGLYILKHSMQYTNFDPFRSSLNIQKYVEKKYDGEYTGTYFSGFYNTDEKALYYWTHSSNTIANNTNLTIYKFDMITENITNFQFLCKPGWNVADLAISGIYNKIFMIDDSTSSDGKISMYDIINQTYTSLSTIAYNQYCRYSLYILNGLLYISNAMYNINLPSSSYNRQMILNLSTGVYKYTPLYGGFEMLYNGYSNYFVLIPPYNNNQIVFGYMGDYTSRAISINRRTLEMERITNRGDDGVNTFSTPQYLATINNLDTPIEKTNEKTMKITYKISYEED